MAIAPILPITPGLVPAAALQVPSAPSVQHGAGSFADLLSSGLDAVDTKVAKADALMKAFAMGEAVPIHQVTIALEEARIAVELAVQVRERLTETYRSFMNMQL